MIVRIVIADDHQLFIDGIKSILRHEIGLEVVGEANDGLRLLQLIERGVHTDLVMTDIRMPIMDGINLTKVLSKDYPSLPVLALSMYEQPADVVEMISAGAKGYIVKNAGKTEMIQAIHAVSSGQTFYTKKLREQVDAEMQDRSNIAPKLTRREKEILLLISRDRTSQQIAEELHISKYTVDTHRKNIHRKLGIQTNSGLIKYALQQLL
ncbi:MAG: response regulator transcription factor [Bacteroidota bacterium]